MRIGSIFKYLHASKIRLAGNQYNQYDINKKNKFEIGNCIQKFLFHITVKVLGFGFKQVNI